MEAEALDWRKSKGNVLSRKEFYQGPEEQPLEDEGHVLGGDLRTEELDQRDVLASAALRRLENLEKVQLESKKDFEEVGEDKEVEVVAPMPEKSAENVVDMETDESNEVEGESPSKRQENDSISNENLQEVLELDSELSNLYESSAHISKRVEESLSKVLQNISQQEGRTFLGTADKILKNIIHHPSELKFRQISKTSKTFEQNIGRHLGSQAFMESIGFEKDTEQNWVLKRNDIAFLYIVQSVIESKTSSS